jgi:hypothetical protein
MAVGGYSSWGADDPVASAEIYDPARDSWSPAGALRAPREGFSLVALQDGGALVLGGRQRRAEPDAAGAIFEAASTPETFEPAGNTWRRLENAQLRGGAPVQLPDGWVFVLDGRTVRLLDPLTGIVRSGAPLPTERGDAQAILLADGSVLVGGGWSQAANPGDTPSCASPDPRVWRYFPGS